MFPGASINAVVLDLISYPGTTWGNPESLVEALNQRYPGKPIILNVSASGSSLQKAAWLYQVGVAAESHHDVYALIYHDASPSLTPNKVLDNQWSMDSDSDSLSVMSHLASQLQQHYAGI